MGALDVLNGISSGVGIAGGLTSLIFGQSQARKQARYQQKMQLQLMDKQQQYAKENAATDYARQRALITDNASLEKRGKQLAGLSTAGDFGNGSASVSPISAPSAPSAPTIADPNQTLLNGLSMAQNSVKDLISNRYANAQADSLELDNEIKRKSLPELTLGSKGRGKSDWAQGQRATGTLPYDIKTAKANAIQSDNAAWQSENDAAYSSANAFANAQTAYNNMLSAKQAFELAKQQFRKGDLEYQLAQDLYDYQVDQAKQTVVNLRKQGVAIDASADASRAAAADSRSHVNVNRASASNIAEDTKSKRLANQFTRDSYSDRLQAIKLQSLPKDLYTKIQLWRSNGTFEKLDGLQQLGYGLYEALHEIGVKPKDIANIIKLLK
jgi:hypothetical protein